MKNVLISFYLLLFVPNVSIADNQEKTFQENFTASDTRFTSKPNVTLGECDTYTQGDLNWTEGSQFGAGGFSIVLRFGYTPLECNKKIPFTQRYYSNLTATPWCGIWKLTGKDQFKKYSVEIIDNRSGEVTCDVNIESKIVITETELAKSEKTKHYSVDNLYLSWWHPHNRWRLDQLRHSIKQHKDGTFFRNLEKDLLKKGYHVKSARVEDSQSDPEGPSDTFEAVIIYEPREKAGKIDEIKLEIAGHFRQEPSKSFSTLHIVTEITNQKVSGAFKIELPPDEE